MQLLNRTGDRVTRWLTLLGVARPVALIGTATTAALMTPGYSPASETISQLGSPGTPFPQIISLGFLAYGFLMAPLALALHRSFDRNYWSIAIAMLLMAYALGFVLAGLFRTDSDHQLAVGLTENAFHQGAARMAFSAIVLTISAVTVIVWRRPGWEGFSAVSVVALIIAVGLGVAFVTVHGAGITGTLELGLLAITVAWVEMLGVRLYKEASGNRMAKAEARIDQALRS